MALVTASVIDTKIGEVENKIPAVTYLVKNELQCSDIETEYLTTSDFISLCSSEKFIKIANNNYIPAWKSENGLMKVLNLLVHLYC